MTFHSYKRPKVQEIEGGSTTSPDPVRARYTLLPHLPYAAARRLSMSQCIELPAQEEN